MVVLVFDQPPAEAEAQSPRLVRTGLQVLWLRPPTALLSLPSSSSGGHSKRNLWYPRMYLQQRSMWPWGQVSHPLGWHPSPHQRYAWDRLSSLNCTKFSSEPCYFSKPWFIESFAVGLEVEPGATDQVSLFPASLPSGSSSDNKTPGNLSGEGGFGIPSISAKQLFLVLLGRDVTALNTDAFVLLAVSAQSWPRHSLPSSSSPQGFTRVIDPPLFRCWWRLKVP